MAGHSAAVIGHPHGVALDHLLAFPQVLCGRQRVVEGVNPLARVAVEGDRSVPCADLTFEFVHQHGGMVRVCRQHLPRGGGCTCHHRTIVGVARLNDGTLCIRCTADDQRHIVGTGDGDGQALIHVGAEVIGGAGCVGLGDRLAFLEGLGGREAVVEGVGPHTGAGVQGEGAVGA